jgi:hypothetical protein
MFPLVWGKLRSIMRSLLFHFLLETNFVLPIEISHVHEHRVSRSETRAVYTLPSKKVFVRSWDASDRNDLGGRGFGGNCSSFVVCRRLYHSTGVFR